MPFRNIISNLQAFLGHLAACLSLYCASCCLTSMSDNICTLQKLTGLLQHRALKGLPACGPWWPGHGLELQ